MGGFTPNYSDFRRPKLMIAIPNPGPKCRAERNDVSRDPPERAAAHNRRAHLEAFYYAALRLSEAVMLRDTDLHLPNMGRIDLAASRAGRS
jgi:hypothetical protein